MLQVAVRNTPILSGQSPRGAGSKATDSSFTAADPNSSATCQDVTTLPGCCSSKFEQSLLLRSCFKVSTIVLLLILWSSFLSPTVMFVIPILYWLFSLGFTLQFYFFVNYHLILLYRFNLFALPLHGTEWPIMCWCAVKKLLTHSKFEQLRRRLVCAYPKKATSSGCRRWVVWVGSEIILMPALRAISIASKFLTWVTWPSMQY